jgi:hypothetical protein
MMESFFCTIYAEAISLGSSFHPLNIIHDTNLASA